MEAMGRLGTMNKLFEYIFYRVYKLYQRRDSSPEIYASGVLSVMQFFTLLSLLAIVRMIFDFPIPSKYFIIPVLIALIAINWYKFEYRLDFEKLDNQWGNEDIILKRKRGWLILGYLIFCIVFPITIGILKHNLGLI